MRRIHPDIYEVLAKKLDAMPQGFPATHDGLELRILRWIFMPEEVEAALQLSSNPESLDQIARRLDKSIENAKLILDAMTAKGQILCFAVSGVEFFQLMPWVPGIWEGQYYREDKSLKELEEFTEMYEAYYPTFAKVGSYGPAFARPIPIGETVKSVSISHRLEDVQRMVNEAASICLMPCVCRESKGINRTPCKHATHVCLILSKASIDLTKYPPTPKKRLISKEEAYNILDRAEEEGLVHMTQNMENPLMDIICNCCSCCCVTLRAVKEHGAPYMVFNNFLASIDHDTCNACGICAEERCPVGAIEENNGCYRVDTSRCIGCGVCAVKCPAGSIKLYRRPEPEQYDAMSYEKWMRDRCDQRAELLNHTLDITGVKYIADKKG